MKKIHTLLSAAILGIVLLLPFSSKSQDKIYRADGTIILAKVSTIEPGLVRYTRTEIPSSPVYTMRAKDIDSIVYENGVVDNMIVLTRRRVYKENIPQLNTWNFNLAGFAHLSINQAYERRTKNGKIGFRVPLYIGFAENRIAGVGTFLPFEGVDPRDGYGYDYVKKSCNVAVGFNPKFYLFKHRVIRVFAGPEADIGFTIYKFGRNNNYNYGYYNYPIDKKTYSFGTFSTLGVVGISLNPKDKFNITINGGAGAGSLFGKSTKAKWLGVWQIGISLGTNF